MCLRHSDTKKRARNWVMNLRNGILKDHRASEHQRADTVLNLLPEKASTALDIGAREGFFSLLLADRYASVVALDLSAPKLDRHNISCVAGDICKLQFDDNAFDVVLCTEVLEHIPPNLLAQACQEVARVTKGVAVISVPYKQDLRVGKTTCTRCGTINPPWGHVNSLDENRLTQLFARQMRIEKVEFIGTGQDRTNALSAWMLDVAGNPFGTYMQEEPCVSCGQPLQQPKERTMLQRLLTRGAFALDRLSRPFTPPTPLWIHVRLAKL